MGVRAAICLSLFIWLFIYLFREYLSGFFYHCVSIVISFNFIIFGDTFHRRIDVHLGPQMTLKILAWMAKNLKALKGNISLMEALTIVGFSLLSYF